MYLGLKLPKFVEWIVMPPPSIAIGLYPGLVYPTEILILGGITLFGETWRETFPS
jgi:hypothetical protein